MVVVARSRQTTAFSLDDSVTYPIQNGVGVRVVAEHHLPH